MISCDNSDTMSDSESIYRVKRPKRVADKGSKVITLKGSNPNQTGFVIIGNPDSKRVMGPPNTIDVRKPNSLSLQKKKVP